MLNISEMLDSLAEKTGKNKEELMELLEKRKEKYKGLLTDQGALLFLAKEFNVEIDLTKASETLKVSDLRAGLKNVDLIVSVKKIFSEKKFEKNQKKGRIINLIVADDTAEIRLSLWHKDTELIEKLHIERGNKLKLSNCIVTEYNGKIQLSLGYNGKIEVIGQEKKETKKINELREEMQDIDVIGVITRKFQEKEFNFKGEERKLLNFELEDETGKIRCTAWNNLAEKINEISTGTKIKIEGAYTKKGLNNLELHLGWNARIIENYWAEMPELKKFERELKRISLKELSAMEAQQNIEVKAMIVTLNRNELHYKACKECGKKLKEINEALVCENCGEKKDFNIKPFVSLIIDDGSQLMKAVLFGEAVQKIGVKTEELKEKIENQKINDYLNEMEEKIVGKIYLFQGRTKRNNYTNEIELICNNIKEINNEREVEKMLEKSTN